MAVGQIAAIEDAVEEQRPETIVGGQPPGAVIRDSPGEARVGGAGFDRRVGTERQLRDDVELHERAAVPMVGDVEAVTAATPGGKREVPETSKKLAGTGEVAFRDEEVHVLARDDGRRLAAQQAPADLVLVELGEGAPDRLEVARLPRRGADLGCGASGSRGHRPMTIHDELRGR